MFFMPKQCLDIELGKTILVLNSSYEPINITNWKRAVVLLLKEKAQVLSKRVIRLLNYVKIPIAKIASNRPSKSLIYKRDKNKCQYCGSTKNLTIDHVIPRCKGGKDTWDNLVVACSTCNVKKGHKTLEQVNMRLVSKPKAYYNSIEITLKHNQVTEWGDYVFT
jgi:CRISPR/Cas system Type II protein with McrA/HNH and RuvC-like nuclease domain